MSEQLRVLVVGPYPREEGKIKGGVEAVTYYLSECLAERCEIEAHVITSVAGLSTAENRESSAGASVHLLPLHGRFGCLTRFAVDASRIRSVLHSIKPDIVHVHGQTVYPYSVMDQGYPVVLTPHGVFYQEARLAKGFMNQLQARLGCGYERRALRKARHIILLNRYLKESFGGLLGDSKVHYIDNPIDDKFFDVADHIQEQGSILFLGVMLERKGVLHLAEACSILQSEGHDFQVWIVGPVGDAEYLNRVKQYVVDHELTDRFEFLGLVPEEEVMDRYARCSMLVLPSFEETAPMVISQAQAASKPVVASSVGGIPEMIENDVTGYTVPFGDSKGLADRIGRLLKDTEKRREMGATARQVAEKRYRRSSVVEKTLSVYREALADAQGG